MSGHIAGMAEGGAGVVVLTPTFVAVEPLLEQGRFRIAEGVAGRTAPARDRPYALLDEVIAHECWHYLDADIRVSGVAYVELMAALGDALGVAEPRARVAGARAWRAARVARARCARLVGSVSAYAATSPRGDRGDVRALVVRKPAVRARRRALRRDGGAQLPGAHLTGQLRVSRWMRRHTERYASRPSPDSQLCGPEAIATRSATLPHTSTLASDHASTISW